MSVTCVGTAPPGNYSLTITATSASIQHTIPATLSINGFSLTLSPTAQTVTRGSAVNYTATVNLLNGYSGTETLSVTGLPTGATATFSPSSLSASGTSTMNVQTVSTTPTGTFSLSVKATNSSTGLYHTQIVTMTVK
jgi:uncharacterized membrane protein